MHLFFGGGGCKKEGVVQGQTPLTGAEVEQEYYMRQLIHWGAHGIEFQQQLLKFHSVSQVKDALQLCLKKGIIIFDSQIENLIQDFVTYAARTLSLKFWIQGDLLWQLEANWNSSNLSQGAIREKCWLRSICLAPAALYPPSKVTFHMEVHSNLFGSSINIMKSTRRWHRIKKRRSQSVHYFILSNHFLKPMLTQSCWRSS